MMLSLLANLAVAAVLAQQPVVDAEYYKAIQKGAEPLEAEAFAKLEADAREHFAAPEAYLPLARAFAATTERVWAVIYGEMYLDLLPADGDRNGIDALVFQLYDDAIEKTDKGLGVSLTKVAMVDANDPKPPFATNFELALLLGCIVQPEGGDKPTLRSGIEPLTIQALTEIRRAQLATWKEKGFATTELMRWQMSVVEAGHFDAYNQWLFRGARPDEFKEWLGSHQKEHDAWVEWQREHPLKPASEDFQRLEARS